MKGGYGVYVRKGVGVTVHAPDCRHALRARVVHPWHHSLFQSGLWQVKSCSACLVRSFGWSFTAMEPGQAVWITPEGRFALALGNGKHFDVTEAKERLAEVAKVFDWPPELADDLTLIAATPVATSRYKGYQKTYGVPVRITVGYPKFWRKDKLGPLEMVSEAAPWEKQIWNLPDDQAKALYEARCEDHLEIIVKKLAELARRFPGQRLVLLCYEDVHKGEVCHRSWFADWFWRRFGITIPELPT
jgi:hypothetical protein